VFVSIGGGDGEEILSLLKNSRAPVGILLEQSRALADQARRRAYEVHPKRLMVIEGDAQEKVAEAIGEAQRCAHEDDPGGCIAVTCHAVIHELFDRSRSPFDALDFFAKIFSADVPTSLTYREPGLPEKWPAAVLLRARCASKSILALSEAIRLHHSVLRDLNPKPSIVGDHVRLHRTLAMEVLAKLFYLEDIVHEIEERSTAVDHNALVHTLWMAIGDTARQENRAQVWTVSAPTDAFIDLWNHWGVEVVGLDADNRPVQLGIAESQTRVIAWRLMPESVQSSPRGTERRSTEFVRAELSVASDALARRDDLVLTALIESRGRTWIESSELPNALQLLTAVRLAHPSSHRAHLWSLYNTSLAALFAGETVDAQWFARNTEGLAAHPDLNLLYHAERMEFYRRSGHLEEALREANDLREHIAAFRPEPGDASAAYSVGTAYFVSGNLMRHGGQYEHGFRFVDSAQACFMTGLPSHDTELAHCYYSKQVCIAMTGKSAFDAPLGADADFSTRQFAYALITLSYSHAAWFVGDVDRARTLAIDASNRFAEIGFRHYADRAQNLGRLLSLWHALSTGAKPDYTYLHPDLARLIQICIGQTVDPGWLADRFRYFRPSTAVGILQFLRQFGKSMAFRGELVLPPTIIIRESGSFEFRGTQSAASLDQADILLRGFLAIPPDLRIPLMAD